MSDANAQAEFDKWMNSQSGYVGKENKAQWWQNYETHQKNQNRFNDYFSDKQTGMTISGGSVAEDQGRIDGLERAKLLTGQNAAQIGENNKQAFENIKKRTTQSDTGSELLRANKAGAIADARNQLQAQGVKGGAALNAVSQVERAKSYDVNNQLLDNQRKAEQDYMNATKANANFTQASEMNYGALAAGKDFQMPNSYSNGFGTVICTELHNQGYFSETIMIEDYMYGLHLRTNRPHVYAGYRLWADYVVKGMKKSEAFTRLVAFFALPWAMNMAGHKNRFGAFISFVGEPLCGALGKLSSLGAKYGLLRNN